MNQINIKKWGIFICTPVFLIAILLLPQATATILYKRYMVSTVDGQDILCEPYIVQKNDFVTKILNVKGEISGKDFPEFLRIFKQLNPHIKNVDRIHPDQRIFIPLKKLPPGAIAGQSTGVITIPFVTLSSTPELLEDYQKTYTVKRGDSVSAIIDQHFAGFGSKDFKKGIELFKEFNPQIKNLNSIHVGEKLVLPEKSLRNEAWFDSLFNKDLNISKKGAQKPHPPEEKKSPGMSTPSPAPAHAPKKEIAANQDALHQVSNALGAKLHSTGAYFFPRADGDVLKLELSDFPVMELKTGRRLMFYTDGSLPQKDQDVINTAWKQMIILPYRSSDSFNDVMHLMLPHMPGVDMGKTVKAKLGNMTLVVRPDYTITPATPDRPQGETVCVFNMTSGQDPLPAFFTDYLKSNKILIRQLKNGHPVSQSADKAFFIDYTDSSETLSTRDFVDKIVRLLGEKYNKKSTFSFTYAGMPLDIQTDMIVTAGGEMYVVDYGNLYGDAVESIRKSSVGFIQLGRRLTKPEALDKLTTEMRMKTEQQPVISVPLGAGFIRLTLKGQMVTTKETQLYFTDEKPDNMVVRYLQQRNIKTFLLL